MCNSCFVSFLREFSLKQLTTDSCVLVRISKEVLIIAIYVDDGLVCCSDKSLLNETISYLKDKFGILAAEAQCYVGLQIKRDRTKRLLGLHQTSDILQIVQRFEMEEAEISSASSVSLRRSGRTSELIGSLMYVSVGSRPDIACAVSILSRFLQLPKLPHWNAAKKVLGYLKSTSNYGLTYDGKESLIAYSDADYTSCCDTRKSITGIVVKLCSAPVIWKATKQTITAESTTEAEFIACSSASREIVWMRNFVSELGISCTQPTPLKLDDQSAIKLVKNNQIHSKIKQPDVRLMAVSERESQGQINVEYVQTNEQEAVILTKPLPTKRFQFLRSLLGILPIMIIAILAVGRSCDALRINLKSKTSPIRSQLVLKVESPCAKIRSIERDMSKAELSTSYKVNASMSQVTYDLCERVFKNKIEGAIKEMSYCMPAHRYKRAALSRAGDLIDFVVGVTNFIHEAFVESTRTS